MHEPLIVDDGRYSNLECSQRHIDPCNAFEPHQIREAAFFLFVAEPRRACPGEMIFCSCSTAAALAGVYSGGISAIFGSNSIWRSLSISQHSERTTCLTCAKPHGSPLQLLPFQRTFVQPSKNDAVRYLRGSEADRPQERTDVQSTPRVVQGDHGKPHQNMVRTAKDLIAMRGSYSNRETPEKDMKP